MKNNRIVTQEYQPGTIKNFSTESNISLQIQNNEEVNQSKITEQRLEQLKKLEQLPLETFIESHNWIKSEPSLINEECFLYHGIRFGNQLEKLENIFKERKILASKYLDRNTLF